MHFSAIRLIILFAVLVVLDGCQGGQRQPADDPWIKAGRDLEARTLGIPSRNIVVRNIQFDTTRSVIMIDSDYKNQGSCCPPLFKNIFIENISATHATCTDHLVMKGVMINGKSIKNQTF